MKWITLILLAALIAVPVGAQIAPAGMGFNVTMDHIPLWFVFKYAAPQNITSYNFTPDVDFPGNNSWMILGSNDGHTVNVLDERVNTPLAGGVNSSFALTTTGYYKYYYIYLFTGFSTTGDHLEVHLYANGEEIITSVYIAGEV